MMATFRRSGLATMVEVLPVPGIQTVYRARPFGRAVVKSQAPNPKLQPLPTPNSQSNSQIQLPNPNPPPRRYWDLALGVAVGIWELGVVGAWDLELGI